MKQSEFDAWKDGIEQTERIDLAVMYDPIKGWRVCCGNINGKMIAMSHASAKQLSERSIARLAASGMPDSEIENLRQHYSDMAKCADECRIKNRDGVVPDGYAEMMGDIIHGVPSATR